MSDQVCLIPLITDGENNSGKILRQLAEKNPESKAVLLQKADIQDKKHEKILNKNEFLNVLNQVDQVLKTVEDELTKHEGGLS